MGIIAKDNIFSGIPARLGEELFQTIQETGDFKLERIISHGQATAPGVWLEEPDAEWVMVVKGHARLRLGRQAAPVELSAGDYLLIPAGTPHRVEYTDPREQTVWLALHFLRARAREADEERFSVREVKVIRTRRRRKTTSARIDKGTMYVRVPATMSEEHLKKTIDDFRRRFGRWLLKKRLNRQQDLSTIAQALNKKYFGGRLTFRSIEYVTDQYRKFGCCDYRRKAIRISHRLSRMPEWVRDYVIIHELAHLQEPHHRTSFWDLVSAYPLAERARGYLVAQGFEIEEERALR